MEEIYKGIQQIRERFGKEVSTAQLLVFLGVLNKPGITMYDLQNELSLTSSNITKNVKKLEDGGWLFKQPWPENGRIMQLNPTSKSYNLLEDLKRGK